MAILTSKQKKKRVESYRITDGKALVFLFYSVLSFRFLVLKGEGCHNGIVVRKIKLSIRITVGRDPIALPFGGSEDIIYFPIRSASSEIVEGGRKAFCYIREAAFFDYESYFGGFGSGVIVARQNGGHRAKLLLIEIGAYHLIAFKHPRFFSEVVGMDIHNSEGLTAVNGHEVG
jgi:hypothetical protein